MGNEILIPEMPQLRQMVLLGEHLAIVIEVKADCTRKNIDKFMDHMKNHFRPRQPHPLLTPQLLRNLWKSLASHDWYSRM